MQYASFDRSTSSSYFDGLASGTQTLSASPSELDLHSRIAEEGNETTQERSSSPAASAAAGLRLLPESDDEVSTSVYGSFHDEVVAYVLS